MSDDRSPGQIVPSGWRVVLGVVAAVLLVVGVGLLLVRAAGFGEVRDAIEKADSTWFIVCLGAQVVALAAYAAVFRGAFSWNGTPDPGFRLSAYVMLASIGATRVFAAGGVGAIAVTYWCFRRARFSAEDALVRVLGFNALFYVAFGIGAWTAALVTVTGSWGDVPRAFALPWLVVVPALAVAAVVATEPSRVERLTRPGGITRASRPRVRRRGSGLGALCARGSGGAPNARPRPCSTGPATSRACGRRCARSARRFRFRSWFWRLLPGTRR